MSASLFFVMSLVNIILRLPGITNKQTSFKLVLSFLLAIAFLLPIQGTPIVQPLASLFSSISITTLMIVLFWLLSAFKVNLPESFHRELKILLTSLVVLGALFYPMTLGLTLFDPYELGYQPYGLLAGLFILILLTIHKQYWFIFTTIIFAVTLYQSDVGISPNLWDYLIDPVGCFIAIILLCSHFLRFCLRKILGYTSIKM